MKNRPNKFRVTYLIQEGDSYAGGWGQRTTDIKHLGQLADFSNVESVRPIFVEVGESLDAATLQTAIDQERAKRDKQQKIDALRHAENQVAKAKADLGE